VKNGEVLLCERLGNPNPISLWSRLQSVVELLHGEVWTQRENSPIGGIAGWALKLRAELCYHSDTWNEGIIIVSFRSGFNTSWNLPILGSVKPPILTVSVMRSALTELPSPNETVYDLFVPCESDD
jgi:hypothetical protein